MKADIVCAKQLPRRVRQNMFAAVLLHMVKAHHAVNHGFNCAANGKRFIAKVQNTSAFFRHVRNGSLAQLAAVAELPAPFGEEHRFVKLNGKTVFAGFAGGNHSLTFP